MTRRCALCGFRGNARTRKGTTLLLVGHATAHASPATTTTAPPSACEAHPPFSLTAAPFVMCAGWGPQAEAPTLLLLLLLRQQRTAPTRTCCLRRCWRVAVAGTMRFECGRRCSPLAQLPSCVL